MRIIKKKRREGTGAGVGSEKESVREHWYRSISTATAIIRVAKGSPTI